ncbi:MAG TPA: helix-turn-helix transcriptional regulator [Candidatus Egerieicola faecale]|uniref:Helix-turn-helix transcriptional regulator n=1 Tax=Candidatus Egerieicola faecale TaxID=2840774 RepID=A0A9D1LL20_9FIRM|nr:helix-turn-helix transcriptional regulator [Candidatus Egerieicola faecale]
MNSDFPRILSLLRKERGLSQKQAAAELHVSQSLLSHYEKGIRECGLDFLVRTADFYGVSCDYLLGRSPERTGATLLVDDLPEADVLGKENRMRGGSILPTLNKRLMINSLNIVFSLLERIGDTKLTKSLSLYLMMDIYLAFRMLYELNPKNLSTLFVVDKARYPYLADAQRLMQRADLSQLMLQLSKDLPGEKTLLSTEQLQANYPLFTSSLLNLIKNVEVTLEQT